MRTGRLCFYRFRPVAEPGCWRPTLGSQARCSTTARLGAALSRSCRVGKTAGDQRDSIHPPPFSQLPAGPAAARSRSLFCSSARLFVPSRKEGQLAPPDVAQVCVRIRQSRQYCCTVEVEPPRSGRRASQRIRTVADERNTAINYNSRLRPGLEVIGGVKIAIGRKTNGAAAAAARRRPNILRARACRQEDFVGAAGVDVWHAFVSDCVLPPVYPRRLLTFAPRPATAAAPPESVCAAVAWRVRPSSPQNRRPDRQIRAPRARPNHPPTSPTCSRRHPTDGPNRPKLDPNMGKL